MKKDNSNNQYRDTMASLPELKSTIKRDKDGNITSIAVHATGKPLYTEKELERFEIPKHLWFRFD